MTGGRAAASKKIIRPWSDNDDKEVYLADPWLQDDPKAKKMFSLAGFVSGARMTSEEVTRDKAELMAGIRSLGAEVIETDEWDDRQVL